MERVIVYPETRIAKKVEIPQGLHQVKKVMKAMSFALISSTGAFLALIGLICPVSQDIVFD